MPRDETGPLEKNLARRLRELAEEKQKPLYIVAELAGFSRPAFWAILNEQSSPTLKTVQRLPQRSKSIRSSSWKGSEGVTRSSQIQNAAARRRPRAKIASATRRFGASALRRFGASALRARD